MPKYLPLIWSDARGSSGGTIFSSNRAGLYTKPRTKPSNPRTAPQMLIRGAVSSVAPLWSSTLTQTQRNEWIQYGQTNPVVSKLGSAMILSGFNVFMRINVPLFAYGGSGAVQLDAPGAVPFLPAPTWNPASQLGLLSGTYTLFSAITVNSNASGNTYMLCFITRPASAGTSVAHLPMQNIFSSFDSIVPPYEFDNETTDPYNASRYVGCPYRLRAMYITGNNISTDAYLDGVTISF